MTQELKPKPQPNPPSLFYRFDSFIKTFIPNFNVRAVLYMSLVFALALLLKFWRV